MEPRRRWEVEKIDIVWMEQGSQQAEHSGPLIEDEGERGWRRTLRGPAQLKGNTPPVCHGNMSHFTSRLSRAYLDNVKMDWCAIDSSKRHVHSGD